MNISDFEIFKQNSYQKFINDGREFLINREPYLDIVLTDYCHANCKFCIGSLVHKKEKIDFGVLKEKVKFAVDNMGVKDVLLLGGEPTVSSILLEVIAFLKTLPLQKIIMTTNGLLFAMNHNFRDKILSSGLTNVNISFMNENIEKQHSIVRGPFTLSLKRIQEIYKCAQKNNVKVRINNNIFKYNHDTLSQISDFYDSIEYMCDSVKFSPLLRTDLFSVVPEKTEWVKENILTDEEYDELFESIEKCFSTLYCTSVITNEEQFGFVKNSMIPLTTPIILNWNQHGQMMKKVVEERKINNIKLLSIGELSLSWNREMPEYFIKTN
jgi:molybdenum cofactor biosynthesis enzyme MoaA